MIYGYLCDALTFGVEEVFVRLHELESMVDDMKERKPEVVLPLKTLLTFLRYVEDMVKKSFKPLIPLMRAIEWWQSGEDGGEEDVDEAFQTLVKKLGGDEGD